MDISRLTQIAGRFVKEQLSRQEGFPINFKAAFVRTGKGDYKVSLESGKIPTCERIEGKALNAVKFDSYGSYTGVHPPIFDLRDHIDEISFPLRIPYSTMAGPLMGRGGYLTICENGEIIDEVIWES